MRLNIKELKSIVSKLNLAIEKTKINPKSGWIELLCENNKLDLKVANYDYYLKASIDLIEGGSNLHATILSDTFIPLVSKLDDDYVDIEERSNSLIFTTDTNEYTFPIIKELGKVKSIDSIQFNCHNTSTKLLGVDLSTISTTNAKGLLDSVFSNELQQYIYVDNIGAITFTENIYINDFSKPSPDKFKFLLNSTQAKLLDIFKDIDTVNVYIEEKESFNASSAIRVLFESDNLYLVVVTQSLDITEKFPSIRLRNIANNDNNTHVILDKKKLDKALARLMVFDKKFDITVMNYSKLVFGINSVKLVSIKNNNYEIIQYISSTNAIEHESMIRFADLMKQLKAINSKDIDISYGNGKAIVINGNIKQLIPEISMISRV
jgi:hypothetical protein